MCLLLERQKMLIAKRKSQVIYKCSECGILITKAKDDRSMCPYCCKVMEAVIDQIITKG